MLALTKLSVAILTQASVFAARPTTRFFHLVLAAMQSLNSMCIEQMGEHIDKLEADLAVARAETAMEQATTATVRLDLAAVQSDLKRYRDDEEATRAEARGALPLF
jgi:hypothetical protein